MNELLTGVDEVRGRALVAIGGSWITPHRSATSDRDLFAIAEDGCMDAVRGLVAALPKVDLEARSRSWLDDMIERLNGFEMSISAGPSPFSFWDLRFLARIATGRTLLPQEAMGRQIASVERRLLEALATYVSSHVVALYEDMFGFFLHERHDEALALGGELCQQACLLAQLQRRLIDPSPKWAFAMARESGSVRLQSAVDDLLHLLGHYREDRPTLWVRSLLNAVNRVIAVGILDEACDASVRPRDGAANEVLRTQLDMPSFCLMGVPGFLTMANIATGKIALCNMSYVHGLAASAA